MAPILNTTLIICNTTAACVSALSKVEEQLDDAYRLNYILGANLALIFLLFICSPLIFNLPRDSDGTVLEARTTPPTSENTGIEMQNMERDRELPSPEEFVVPNEDSGMSRVSPENLREYASIELEGERFHIRKSEPTILAETGIFRGLGDERELARRCVVEGSPALSVVKSSPRDDTT